jgi:proteasome accessory factor B
MDRSVRLVHLQSLFYHNPRGFRVAELARRCEVDHRTINRDLADLQQEPFHLPLVLEENWTWRLMEGHRFTLAPLHLTLQEASALYLAARLLDRVSDEPNPYVRRALAALAGALPAGVSNPTMMLVSGRLEDEEAAFARVFAVISLAWATCRKVHIRYRAAVRAEARETDLSPYCLEPSGPGYATYVIGFASHAGAVRTFKLERIDQATLLDEVFTVPAEFDALRLLGSAWGVMYGEDTVEVVLRFSPGVARRVGETVWHGSQVLEACEDGGCLLKVRVAHALEMKPWIRGWGPDCEVLAPAELREEIGGELRAAAEQYQR